MDWKYFQKGALKLSGGFTRCFPRGGAKILDGVLYPLMGNSWLVEGLRKANQRKLRRLSSFKRLLVISDIHIGDAVLMQTAVSALRDFFPGAGIDYMVQKVRGVPAGGTAGYLGTLAGFYRWPVAEPNGCPERARNVAGIRRGVQLLSFFRDGCFSGKKQGFPFPQLCRRFRP